MEWYQLLIIVLSLLFLLLLIRTPVAIAFMFINILMALFLWNGGKGLIQLMHSVQSSLTTISLVPILFFIFMGEIMFHTRIASKIMETLDKWFGKIPARLSLISVGGGTLLSTLTGTSMGSTAVLGSTLLPEMEKRGYKQPMSIGPILGSGLLAAMIPPSTMGVLLASMGKISVGSFLMAIIIPGFLLALFMVIYLIVRSLIQPDLAPPYEVQKISLTEKIKDTCIYILPLGLIIFLVIGLLFLGLASPNESAAMGSIGSLILAIFYRTLNKETFQKAIIGTLEITGKILFIIASSTTFSQILSFSGATQELVNLVDGAPFSPVIILLILLFIVIILGTFLEGLSIMMVILPIYMPIAQQLDFNLIWFGVLILITIEIGAISPPFGMSLFVMKSVAPKNVTMGNIYAAAIPFTIIQLVLIIILILLPELVTWLPGLMKSG